MRLSLVFETGAHDGRLLRTMADDWINGYVNELADQQKAVDLELQNKTRRAKLLEEQESDLWAELRRESKRMVGALRERSPTPRCADLDCDSPDGTTLSIRNPVYPAVTLEITRGTTRYRIAYKHAQDAKSQWKESQDAIAIELDANDRIKITFRHKYCVTVEDLLKVLMGPILKPEIFKNH